MRKIIMRVKFNKCWHKLWQLHWHYTQKFPYGATTCSFDIKYAAMECESVEINGLLQVRFLVMKL